MLLSAAVVMSTEFIGAASVGMSAALPYTSFEDVHHNYWRILQHPAIMASGAQMVQRTFGFYIITLYSIVFFTFFGFGEEAISDYTRIFSGVRSICIRLGLCKNE